MTTNIKRRMLLKGSVAAGTLGLAAGTGLLIPRAVVAAWNEAAFKAESVDDALNAALGDSNRAASDAIKIRAADIAENGAVVPVSISTDMQDVESITLLAEGNNSPLVATFALGEGAQANVSTRIKMAETSDVIAVVKSNGNLHSARKSIKVTIGGCGG